MLVQLLFSLTGEWAFRAGVGSLTPMVHLVLLQLPFGPKGLVADWAMLRVLGVVDLEVEPQRPRLLEPLFASGALKDFVDRVCLQRRWICQQDVCKLKSPPPFFDLPAKRSPRAGQSTQKYTPHNPKSHQGFFGSSDQKFLISQLTV